jgi:F0F1-type ATP synthase assembly protein I
MRRRPAEISAIVALVLLAVLGGWALDGIAHANPPKWLGVIVVGVTTLGFSGLAAWILNIPSRRRW